MNLRKAHDKAAGNIKADVQSKRSIKNKKICCTGTLSKYSRAGVKVAIRKKDAIHRENVTRDVDILVVGTMRTQTAKYTRAVQYNIELMPEAVFYKLMGLRKDEGFVK